MKKKDLAISTVLSTTILASTLLVIVGVSSYAAINAVNAQIENVQFEQAKNVLLSVSQIVKKVMYTPHSSGYVRSSFWMTVPYFIRTNENLTINLIDDGENITFDLPVNIIKIKGGPQVGILTPQNILGEEVLLYTKISGSLGNVRVFQSEGAWTSLDYLRARCNYIGTTNYYDGNNWNNETVNVIEITVLNLDFGIFIPGKQAFITVENLGITSELFQVSNNTTIDISITDKEFSESSKLSDLIEEAGGNPEKPIWIRLNFINIEVSMLEGV
jgi:hypothetical protein